MFLSTLIPFRHRARVTVALALCFLITACDNEASELAQTYPCALPAYDDTDGAQVILVGDPQRTGVPERLLQREQNDQARAAVMRGIAAARPDMLIILGDLVYQADDDEAWTHFDGIMHDIRSAGVPVFPILGNHEYFGNDAAGRRRLDARFPPLRGRDWYELRCGPVAFLLLNTNFDEMQDSSVQRQQRWYESRLAALDADDAVRHVVVCGHHPPYTNSMIVSASAEVEHSVVLPFLDARKTALLFSGHCHAYEHFRSGNKHFIVSGGGGGPRQELDRCWHRRYDDLYPGAAVRPFHYCALRIRGDTLRLRVRMLSEDMAGWYTGDSLTVAPHPVEK
ncbi:MAG: metallophosphoesterase [Bacteroidota bacterium]|nr:metallophosphoesterase [Bacteroidota bacterium]